MDDLLRYPSISGTCHEPLEEKDLKAFQQAIQEVIVMSENLQSALTDYRASAHLTGREMNRQDDEHDALLTPFSHAVAAFIRTNRVATDTLVGTEFTGHLEEEDLDNMAKTLTELLAQHQMLQTFFQRPENVSMQWAEANVKGKRWLKSWDDFYEAWNQERYDKDDTEASASGVVDQTEASTAMRGVSNVRKRTTWEHEEV